MKAYSEACERNKYPILQVLKEEFQRAAQVLEIGSGTGQHAAFLARHLPHVRWQPSDLEQHHTSILAWAQEQRVPNVLPPVVLNVDRTPWPVTRADAVFSANTAHIMAWPSVVNLFRGVGEVLSEGGVLCLYGPMNYGGRHTSDSNARFDHWLKRHDPASGIRDFEAIDGLARQVGLILAEDYAMPANNRLLAWHKPPSPGTGRPAP